MYLFAGHRDRFIILNDRSSDFLYKGEILAILILCGNMPVVKDWFTVSVEGIIKYYLITFINELEISSCPELLF